MSLVNGQRLVRALLLGGLVFLVVGGGTGLVMASADGPEPAAMAFPQPGASAAYTVNEFHVGEARGELQVDSFVLTWMPETWVADKDFSLRLVHPLRTEFRSGSAYQVREAFYDAATGEPILTSGEGEYYTGGGVGCGDESECRYRYDYYNGRGGPCAVRNALQEGQALDKPLRITGYCDYVDGADELTYHYAGPERMGNYQTFRFVEGGDLPFEAWFAPDVPFPIRFTSTLSDEIYYGFLGHERMYDLRLADYTPGQGAYTRPVLPLVMPGLGPLEPVPVTARHLFDFTGFPASLGFEEAFRVAAADTSENGLAGFLREHPDAYVAEAYSDETRNQDGDFEYAWFFIVTDGDAWKSLSVRQGLSKTWVVGYAVSLPSATGPSIWVESWTLDQEGQNLRDAGNFYPSPTQLPARLPKPADLLERQRFVENRNLENARYFGWSLTCENVACLAVDSWIGAGYQVDDQSSPVAAGVLESTTGGASAILSVKADGTPIQRRAFTYDRPSYAPLVATGAEGDADFELAPQQMTREAALWQVPGAPAATGLSFFAVLASALYYFWPSLKGLLGFGLFSRIEDGKVLEHPARRNLHTLIEANPGIHFQELSRRSGFGRGQLDHHVRKLEAANLVTRVRSETYTCFFARGQVDRRIMVAAPLLRSEGGRAVLHTLQAKPGASSRDIALHLGLSPGTVSYHVKRLGDAGLLASSRGSLHLTEAGRQATGLAA